MSVPENQIPQPDFESLFAPLSIGQLLLKFSFEKTGMHGFSDWRRYCATEGIYEYPTLEYITLFSRYLESRLPSIVQRHGERPRILEVAAGQGRLTFLLEKAFMEQGGQTPEMLAVDDGSWFWSQSPSIAKQMDYLDALRSFQPHIVLGAWLPNNSERWGHDFRRSPCVDEYIIIGDVSEQLAMEPVEALGDLRNNITDYEADGFTRTELGFLRPFQVSHMDYKVNDQFVQQSTTVSFRRNPNAPSTAARDN